MSPAEYLQHLCTRVENTTCAIALPARLRITAYGPDALRFLNGQMSNQMEKARPGAAIRSCLLTIKGRIVSVPVCWRGGEPDVFLLEIPEEIGEATLQRLDRYLIADQVELAADPAPTTWHFAGQCPDHVLRAGGREFSRFGIPGRDVDGDLSGIDGVTTLSHAEADALRIANKIPGEGEYAAGVFPSEVGLDLTAVDFHKGCYLGQEVVSRLESVGKARRTLVSWTADAVPAVGSQVASAAGERSLGQITTAIDLPHGGAAGLAILREELAKPGARLHALDEIDPSKSTAILQILA